MTLRAVAFANLILLYHIMQNFQVDENVG